ncbi:NAD(P)/FAD-dependent oxidoreductase [Aestuariivirga sp.]|uniref:NAD(P)/FAD-dependent oxidoreductase n=1 Tax=Aestuariivirga sp. TaxID=2650926 RepID=UPI00391CDEE5
MTVRHFDAVVIGGRVAGSAAALGLASAGARVLIVEREAELGDTLSTHALMRPAVELLGRWGLIHPLVKAGTPWVREARFQYGQERVVVPVKPSAVAEGLLAPRRWLLDRMLFDAAVSAGAEAALGTAYEHCLTNDMGRVNGAILRGTGGERLMVSTDLLIGADGRSSPVAGTIGVETLATSPHSAATLYGYFSGVPNEGYRWYFGDRIAAGIIPTTSQQSCVFASCPPEDFALRFGADPLAGLAVTLAVFEPALSGLIRRSGDLRLRRFLGAPGCMRARTGPGWALVGDAAFFRDPATAHGITDALLDAHALSSSLLATGRLDAYGRERDAQSIPLFSITQEIASFECEMERVKALHAELNACMKAELPTDTGHAPRQTFPPFASASPRRALQN